MKAFRKKKPPVGRQPHIQRQKQQAFQYSSRRSPSDRTVRARADQEPSETSLHRFGRRASHLLFLACLIIGAAFASVLSQEPALVITNNQAPLRENYQKDAAEIVGGGPQSFTKFTLDRQKITQELQAKYPEMKNIDVTTPIFSQKAVIKVELAKPALVLSSLGSSYILDNQGVALLDITRQKSSYDPQDLLKVDDQTNTAIITGKQALTSAQVAYALEIRHQSEAAGMAVNSISLTAGGGELHVKHGELPYIVKYNVYEEARKGFGTFIAAKEQADRTGLKPAEYIDVRIPERAYIK